MNKPTDYEVNKINTLRKRKNHIFLLVLIKIGPMIQKLKTLIKGGHFDGHPKKIIGALQCNIEVTI